ncbi:MAG: DUF2892 domain-containing protein [Cocleimonas sp.]|nr:DUF2892 domain-containing protein [Cocleimonas sp.]
MTVSNGVMAGAGIMVLLSVVLAAYVSPVFIWLTVFIGIMMLQSAFTGFCPMAMILKKLGFK